MSDCYELNVAGVTRQLPIIPISPELAIASFVILGDCELVTAAAPLLAEKLPKVDYLVTAEAKGIPLVQERRGDNTPMCANVDMYSGLVYTMLGIPQDVFTPLFASARIAGWCANRMEELITCHRIMRPAYRAVTTHGHYIPMAERQSHHEAE